MKKDAILKLLDSIKTKDDLDTFISIVDDGGRDAFEKLAQAFPELNELSIKDNFDFSEVRTLALKKDEVVIYSPVKLSKELIALTFDSINTTKRKILLKCIVDTDITAGIKIVIGGKIFDFTFDRYLINRTNS